MAEQKDHFARVIRAPRGGGARRSLGNGAAERLPRGGNTPKQPSGNSSIRSRRPMFNNPVPGTPRNSSGL